MKRLDARAGSSDDPRHPQEPALAQAAAGPVRALPSCWASCSSPARSCSPTPSAARSTSCSAPCSANTDVQVSAVPKVGAGDGDSERVTTIRPGVHCGHRSGDVHGVATADRHGLRRRRPAHRRQRQGGHLGRAAAVRRRLAVAGGPGPAPRGQRRRPPTTRSRSTPAWPRRAGSTSATRSACSPWSRKQDVHHRRHRSATPAAATRRAAARSIAFTQPVAQQLMLGQTGVYSAVDVKADRGRQLDDALRDRVAAAARQRRTQVKTGKQLADENAAQAQHGAVVLQQHPDRLRRGRAVRRGRSSSSTRSRSSWRSGPASWR